MRKLLSLAAIAAAVCTASAANATTFTGTFNVDLNTNANGLTVSASPNPGGVNFDLTNTGDFTNVEMFTLYADNESSVNGDDKVAQPISVDFTFSAPSGFGGSVGGTTVGESFMAVNDKPRRRQC